MCLEELLIDLQMIKGEDGLTYVEDGLAQVGEGLAQVEGGLWINWDGD